MKTTIYIDGYNFYYSRLKGTGFKWLDIVELFHRRILLTQEPAAELLEIKFFTSPVKASYARHGQASEHAQTQYHRALQARYPGVVQIIKGFHVFEPSTLPIYGAGTPPDKNQGVRVWVIEEKQTDVNIALHLYRDAVQGQVDQVVVCSNDSDLEAPLRLIRTDTPQVKIGLVMPLREPALADGKVPNKRLTALAHWVRHHIRDEELASSQLPQTVPTKKKPAIKPSHW